MAPRRRATQSELAQILGVNSGTISKTKATEGFPEAREGRYEIKAVVLWWYMHKEGGEKPEPEWSAKTEREQLDLQLKEAKVQQELGDLVKVSELKSELQRLAAKLGDAMETVERTTGHPVDGIIEPVFEEFFTALDKKAGR